MLTPRTVLARRVSSALDASPSGCDPTDTRHCYLPYPTDRMTASDPTAATGRRVALPGGQLANADGVTLDVAEWNRNTGFSPNSTILTFVPGLDAAASRLPSWTDLGAAPYFWMPSIG